MNCNMTVFNKIFLTILLISIPILMTVGLLFLLESIECYMGEKCDYDIEPLPLSIILSSSMVCIALFCALFVCFYPYNDGYEELDTNNVQTVDIEMH
jgi:hypothetical protein